MFWGPEQAAHLGRGSHTHDPHTTLLQPINQIVGGGIGIGAGEDGPKKLHLPRHTAVGLQDHLHQGHQRPRLPRARRALQVTMHNEDSVI